MGKALFNEVRCDPAYLFSAGAAGAAAVVSVVAATVVSTVAGAGAAVAVSVVASVEEPPLLQAVSAPIRAKATNNFLMMRGFWFLMVAKLNK